MAFIGFDLDETLGSFTPIHNHILFLTPENVYRNLLPDKQPFVPSDSLSRKLQAGLRAFAECLVTQDSELGILRKGILSIMRRLADAKANGLVKAVSIYSNNGNLGLLLLASAMIEHAIGVPGFFCTHIDWYNPLRSNEITPGRPGAAIKTAAVLRKAFVDSRCAGVESPADVPLESLYFFDDIEHPYLKPIIGADHYFQVKPYKNEVTNLAAVDDCFDSALRSSDLAEDEEYLAYVKPLLNAFGTQTNTFENILATIKRLNARYVPKKLAFVDDTEAILNRIDSILPPTNYGANYFPISDGGRRKNKKLRRRQIKKTKRMARKGPKRTRKN